MKVKETFILLMIVPLLGCGQSSGVTPPLTAPSMPSPSTGPWTLTAVVTGTSGSSRCPGPYFVPTSATPFTQAMFVQRSVTALTVFVGTDYPDASAEQRYGGTASGDVFTITRPGYLASPQCPSPAGTENDTISGSFSTDGTHLTAHQVITDHWPDADVVTTLDWTADHR
jgi:hypothetical protein